MNQSTHSINPRVIRRHAHSVRLRHSARSSGLGRRAAAGRCSDATDGRQVRRLACPRHGEPSRRRARPSEPLSAYHGPGRSPASSRVCGSRCPPLRPGRSANNSPRSCRLTASRTRSGPRPTWNAMAARACSRTSSTSRPKTSSPGRAGTTAANPARLGWLEFDLVPVHGRALLLAQRAPAMASRPRLRRWLHGGTVLAYGSDTPHPGR